MIAQILDRSFVISQIPKLLKALENPSGVTGGQLPPASERRDLVELIQHTLEQERKASSGYRGFDVVSDRRSSLAPLDKWAFFSHNPVVSLTQSALDRYYRERHAARLRVAPLPKVARDRRSSGPQVPVTNINLPPELIGSDQADGRRVGEEFSQTDIGWIASWVAEGIRLFQGRHPFPPQPAPAVKLADRCRLVLVGDWGSGLPRAVKVAEAIRQVLAQGKTTGLEQHVIHLGDVYYSGWEAEQRDRFLAHWPVDLADGDLIGSWSLNGNHDMFSGGYGYFDTLLGDPRFARQARSNRFSFEHVSWRILGLDTAYDDHDLAGDQAEWVARELTAAKQARQQGFLLSHHQLFSSYEEGGPKLRQKLGEVIWEGLIHTWFWGHEHRCTWYEKFDGIDYARCLGHGGVPVYMNHGDVPTVPPCIWEYRGTLEHGFIEGMLGLKWAKFGFAVLDLSKGQMEVAYLDEDGNESKKEIIR